VTAADIDRVQEHFDTIKSRPLAARFYQILFERHPELRALFPADLSALRAHFMATLDLVISNLGRVTAVDSVLRDLGARHLRFGAQPHHYALVRNALLEALAQESNGGWDETLARGWRLAIATVIIPMLRGAAVETAAVAQAFAAEDTIDRTW
jgi:hemoglobin-like flavoprotein